MQTDKIDDDKAKFLNALSSERVTTAIAQLPKASANNLIKSVMAEISDDLILEGTEFEGNNGLIVRWSHASGGGIQVTTVPYGGWA